MLELLLFAVLSQKPQFAMVTTPLPRAAASHGDRTNFTIEEGALAGKVTFKTSWRDYRGQSVPAGTYELRYAVQPFLKSHVGTSQYRDFLILSPRTTPHPFVMAILPIAKTYDDDVKVIEVVAGDIPMAIVIEGEGEAGL